VDDDGADRIRLCELAQDQEVGMKDGVRSATALDLPGIVEIHLRAFPDSFLTCLGRAFLSAYYRRVLDFEGGILLVHESAGGMDGFVCGFVGPAEFYGRMKQPRWTLAKALVSAILRRPSLAPRVVYNIRRVASDNARLHDGCELSSIAVDPRFWSKGIGQCLVEEFLDQAWAKDAALVYLTTDAVSNETANRFYQRLGFQLRTSFEQYRGRVLNEYARSR
jgi:ribosomal protein S18 acetylase RimI-like enzyme